MPWQASQAAVIRMVDDSIVTGDLKSIDGNELTVTGKSAPVKISLDEIVQISVKDPPPAPAPAPVAAVTPTVVEGPDLGGSLLGALFGSSHSASSAAPASKPVVTAAVPASQPATLAGVFQLTDGDLVHAALQKWSDQKLTLQLAGGIALTLPSTSVSELWLGTPDLQAKARKLAVDPGPEDIAFVTRENEVMVVKGLVQGITGDSLQFRYDEQDRKIGLAKVVGLLLRSNSAAAVPGFHQLVHTENGDQFSGTLSAIHHETLTLMLSTGAALKLPISAITTIDFLNGRVTSLTDLKPTKVQQTPYFGRLIPYRVNQSLAGGPLMLADGPCPRGIAVHSRCVLEYNTSGGFDRFKTRLGFEQPDGHLGRVEARVLGDGKVLYENSDARGDQPPIEIDVSLAKVRVLTLEIDFGKDQDVGDRVIWANPRLLRGK